VPIYHPAYILRNDVLEPQLKQQLAYAASVYHGTLVQAPAATLNVWYPATRKDLPQLLSRIDAMRSSKVVAYDLETTGLSPWKFTTDGQPPSVLTISLASSGEDALVVPWRHPEAFGWEPQEEEAITTSLEGLLLDPAVLKGGHNVKFDDKWLNETMGIDPVQDSSVLGYANQFDTLLAHAMLDPSAPHSLDFLVRRYLFSVYGEYWRETERLASVPGGGKDYRRVPLAVLCEYNGRDSAATWALHRLFEDEVNRRGQHGLLYGHILPASQALRRLEEAGLSLDEEMLVKLLMQSYADIRATKAALMDLTSVVSWVRLHPEFNLGSVAQLAEFMYGHLQLPVVRRTKKRVPSTDAETMTMLRDDPRVSAEGHAFLTCLEEFRSASKTIGTYLTPAKGWCGDTDGLIHSTYNLHVAVTGRLSSQQPGAQQMPETMRPMFVSRWGAAGRIVSADYSGIEFRVVGCITRSKLLLEVFTNPNLDIHCMAADIMFPDLQCGITPHKSAPQCRQCSQRKKSKGLLSFGALYGAQAPGLARKAGLTAEDAQQRLDRYFALLPEIKQYWADIVGKGRQFGYIESLFGRRRYLPDLGSKDQFLRGEAERQAINTPVQSSASDLCLAALVRLTRALEERGLRSRPIVIIHDSIVMDCPEAELGQAVPLMVAIMEDISMYPWAVVPFPVELTIGERWTK
jgi:DNA polymerase-1